MDLDYVKRLYAYHHWATDRLLIPLAQLGPDALDRSWGGSFRSGRALLRHILGAEWVWLERWNGRSPTAVPDIAASGPATPLVEQWTRVMSGQRVFLDTVTPPQLTSPLDYTNLAGQRWTYALGDILLHVVNHGTYHRGQMAHLLRDLQQTPVATDYLVFLDQGARA